MVTIEITTSQAPGVDRPVHLDSGELFRLQLLVARRADQLARRYQLASREADRRLWLRAELDIYDAETAPDRTKPRGSSFQSGAGAEAGKALSLSRY